MTDRDLEQWKKEINGDMGLIGHYLEEAEKAETEEYRLLNFALARKEARRLTSDIQRVARDVYEITLEQLDGVGPL